MKTQRTALPNNVVESGMESYGQERKSAGTQKRQPRAEPGGGDAELSHLLPCVT